MRLINTLSICWLSLAHLGLSLAHPGLVAKDVPNVPPAPGFTHLYTAYADVLNPIYYGEGPMGIRTTLPCVGGNFSGPYFSGKVLDSGADWGVTDPQTGIFRAETRYNLRSEDGATFYVQTSGPQVGGPKGNVHVRVLLETGDKRYYWVNNAVIVGIVQLMDFTDIGFTLRLDTYHMKTELTNTTFINGTTY